MVLLLIGTTPAVVAIILQERSVAVIDPSDLTCPASFGNATEVIGGRPATTVKGESKADAAAVHFHILDGLVTLPDATRDMVEIPMAVEEGDAPATDTELTLDKEEVPVKGSMLVNCEP